MEFYITFGIIISLFVGWYYYYLKSRKKWDEQNSIGDDDTIYVEGVGHVNFDELNDALGGNPDEGVKQVKDTMFRDDLMQFEGEFSITGLPLSEERRLSIDDAFIYLQELFGKHSITEREVVTPSDSMVPHAIHTLSENSSAGRTHRRNDGY